MHMLQFVFIFISSLSFIINFAVTNHIYFSEKNNNNFIKQDVFFDFIDFNLKQCISNRDCDYDVSKAEKIYSLKLKKCSVNIDNKHIYVLYTEPSLSVYVPLNNTNQDNTAIINYQTLENRIKSRCFNSPQDNNLVLGVVSK